jgi:serine/threonine protein kinase
MVYNMTTLDKNTQETLKYVLSARTATELFSGKDAAEEYKRLARTVHPDKLQGLASDSAFVRLNSLYAEFTGKAKPKAPVTFGKWVVDQPICAGDISDIYQVASDKIPRAILKIVRSPKDNDLMANEISTLKSIQGLKCKTLNAFVPTVLDSFKASDRQAVVTSIAEDELRTGGIETLLPLSEIVALHPGPLDFRHVVWMSNRLLTTLCFVHEAGIVHGSITPDHLMFGPESHMMRLVDWSYAVTAKSKSCIKAISKKNATLYPIEVYRKLAPVPATDLFMWAKVVYHLAPNIPKPFRDILQWCIAESPNARPKSAQEVLVLWATAASKVYGSPTYLKLQLPKT